MDPRSMRRFLAVTQPDDSIIRSNSTDAELDWFEMQTKKWYVT